MTSVRESHKYQSVRQLAWQLFTPTTSRANYLFIDLFAYVRDRAWNRGREIISQADSVPSTEHDDSNSMPGPRDKT